MGTASQKVIRNNAGALAEVASIKDSAGAADADKLIATNASGKLDDTFLNLVTASAGAGDAGKLPKLGGDGRLDLSFLPPGVGADVATIQASENLASGDFVNIHNSGGARVRKADATTAGKEAHGFVLAAVTSGQNATVYFEATNTGVTGQTPGPVFLSTTPGQATSTAPSASGNVVQRIGFATGATAINFQSQPPVTLA